VAGPEQLTHRLGGPPEIHNRNEEGPQGHPRREAESPGPQGTDTSIAPDDPEGEGDDGTEEEERREIADVLFPRVVGFRLVVRVIHPQTEPRRSSAPGSQCASLWSWGWFSC